jgi:hypothetical protein
MTLTPKQQKIVDHWLESYQGDWEIVFNAFCAKTGLSLMEAMVWRAVIAVNSMAQAHHSLHDSEFFKKQERFLDKMLEEVDEEDGWKKGT